MDLRNNHITFALCVLILRAQRSMWGIQPRKFDQWIIIRWIQRLYDPPEAM